MRIVNSLLTWGHRPRGGRRNKVIIIGRNLTYEFSILCLAAWWYSFLLLPLVVRVSWRNWLASAFSGTVWMSYPVCAAKLQSWSSVSHLPRDVASQTPLGDRLFLQRGNTRSKRQHLNRADFLRPRQASMPLYVLHFSSAMPASSHTWDSPSDTSTPFQSKVSETNPFNAFSSELSFASILCHDVEIPLQPNPYPRAWQKVMSPTWQVILRTHVVICFVPGLPSISIYLSSNVISSYFLFPSERTFIDSAHEILCSSSFRFVTQIKARTCWLWCYRNTISR